MFCKRRSNTRWTSLQSFFFFTFNTLLHIHAAPHIHTSKLPGKTQSYKKLSSWWAKCLRNISVLSWGVKCFTNTSVIAIRPECLLFTSPTYIFIAGPRIGTCDITVETVTTITFISPRCSGCMCISSLYCKASWYCLGLVIIHHHNKLYL